MINIRHHIASIIGIFLALGLGLIIGSTFISGETIDALEARLDAQEADLDDTQGESDSLLGRVDELETLQQRFEAAAPAHVFDGRLRDESTMVVTVAGTSDSSVQRAIDVLEATDGRFVGVLTLEAAVSDETITDLEAVLDQLAPAQTSTTSAPPSTTTTPPATSTTADPTPNDLPTLEELEAFLASSTTTTEVATTTTSAPAPSVPDDNAVVLQGLLGAGLATFRAAESEVPSASKLLVVLDEDADPDIAASVVALVRAINDGEQPRAVVASADAANLVVDAIRSDIDLALLVPTVSHIDSVIGQLAAVLALEDLSVPFVEHYGNEDDLLLLPPGEL